VRALATRRFALRLNVLATRVSIPDFVALEDGVSATMGVWPDRFADAPVLLAVCGAIIGWGISTSAAD